MAKRKTVLELKYKKGTILTPKSDVIKHIDKLSTTLELIASGKYDDGKEFIVIKIDNI